MAKGITVTEREQLVERIQAATDAAINRLIAKFEPNYRVKLERQAKDLAIDQLGIGPRYRKLEQLNREIQELEAQRRNMLVDIERSISPVSCSAYAYLDNSLRIERTIEQSQRAWEFKVKQESEIGRMLLHLEQQRQEWCDLVWFAESRVHLHNLWQVINKKLGNSAAEAQLIDAKLDDTGTH